MRTGKQFKCEICGEWWLVKQPHTNYQPKYCSPRCRGAASKAKAKYIEVECAFCKVKFPKLASNLKNSKSGLYFCSRKCKDISGRHNVGILPIKHYKGKSYRNKVTIEHCSVCLNNQIHLLVVHHKDGDHNNNKLDNLEVVCRNCHGNRHVDLKENKLVYNTKCLTNSSILEELDEQSRKMSKYRS